MGERVPLPSHLRNSLRITWHISDWCNYQCAYCAVPVFSRRNTDGTPQWHAFDHYRPEEWLRAFEKFTHEEIALIITGGEPFMDRANFRRILEGLAPQERFIIRVYTNGSWNPDYYSGIDTSRVRLLISFHPGETEFSPFLTRIHRIRDAGFCHIKVHLVLSPESLSLAEGAMERLTADGFLAHVTFMTSGGQYLNARGVSPEAVRIIERYSSPYETYFNVTNPVTKGRQCWHPTFAYRIRPDGAIAFACGGPSVNFIRDPLPALPPGSVPCPLEHCYRCSDMVRSLVETPIDAGPLTVYSGRDADEYLTEWRSRQRHDPNLFRTMLENTTDRYTGENAYQRFLKQALDPEIPEEPYQVPADLVRHAVPDLPMFGYIDKHTGSDTIEARASDRLLFSGWAVSTRASASVVEVVLEAGPARLATFRDFYPRPEVAATFDRPDFRLSGWRGYCFLPRNLPRGDHPLVASAIDSDGLRVNLPPLTLRITA